MNEIKHCNFDISQESYDLVGKMSKTLGMKKNFIVDALIKRYAEHLISDISEKLKIYENE